MKRIALLIMTAFLMGGVAMAQQAGCGNRMPDPKVRAERMTERMVKEYSLNDTQRQLLLAANIALMEKMGDMPMPMKRGKGMKRSKRNSDSCTYAQPCSPRMKGDKARDKNQRNMQMTEEQREKMKAERKTRRAEMEAARKVYNEQLQKIMTKEQYAAYTKNMQDRKDMMQSRRKDMRKK